MTLLAIVLSIVLVVDNAIVVIENIFLTSALFIKDELMKSMFPVIGLI